MIKKRTIYCLAWVFAATLSTHAFAEPANLGQLKSRLIQYHDSGEYQKELESVASNAMQYIDQQVQMNEKLSQPKKLALVLDIDETCLSNYKNMRLTDFSGVLDIITQQYLEADEPAIEPMLALYQNALQHNVAVFFITGRGPSLREATIQNLHAAGYDNWSGLELKDNILPNMVYKSMARSKIAEQGYTILASIGDQYSDLVGGYALKTFKLPNPFYYLP